MTNVGLGGLPWPSHNKLSQAKDTSHRGTSAMSTKKTVDHFQYLICATNLKHESVVVSKYEGLHLA